MIRVAFAGLSHPHVAYFVEEMERRRGAVDWVSSHLDQPEEESRLPSWYEGSIAASTDELFDARPDVVVACGIYADRARIAKEALERGIHVLADKPLATSEADLDALRVAAEASDAVLSVAFEKRWYAATIEARTLIEQGALGELRLIAATGPHKLRRETRPDWYFDDRYGPILADLPTHDIDLALLLSDGAWGTVAGWTSPNRPAGAGSLPDACSVALNIEGRVSAGIDAHWIWPESSDVHGRYQMRLSGTSGTIYIDWASNTVAVESDAAGIDRSAATEQGKALARRPAEDFFDALLRDSVPEVDTRASIAATRIALLAARSAVNGGVPLDWQR